MSVLLPLRWGFVRGELQNALAQSFRKQNMSDEIGEHFHWQISIWKLNILAYWFLLQYEILHYSRACLIFPLISTVVYKTYWSQVKTGNRLCVQ